MYFKIVEILLQVIEIVMLPENWKGVVKILSD